MSRRINTSIPQLLTSAVLGTILIGVPLSASAADFCKGGPKSEWKSVEQVKKTAIEHGYKNIKKVVLEDGCYEVVTVNGEGKIVDVQFDPVTLKLERIEAPR